MKRDARIGLAVVLVLGLAVTLLIGRALYVENDELASVEGENAAMSAADPYGGETRRVEGSEPSNLTTTASAAPADQIAGAADTAAKAELTDPARQFIEDQRARLPVAPAPVPAAPPALAPRERAGAVLGDNTKPAELDAHKELLADDQDGLTPKDVTPSTKPSEGYGYTVGPNENIWKISNKVYGDGKYTQKILAVNPGLQPDKMKVGSVIKIPVIANKTLLVKLPAFADAGKAKSKPAEPVVADSAKKKPAQTPNTSPEAAARGVKVEPDAAPQFHKVQAGETLAAIAKKYYGTAGPKTIAKIVAANDRLDPAKLKVGQEVTLPAKN